jgi:RNA polymerase sigma-70 factor (ECF subfamily)
MGDLSREQSFRLLYEGNVAYVIATLRRLGVLPRDVEDVAHDVFVAVYRHLDEYDPSRPLRPWLFVFTYRAARDYQKLARHRTERGEDAGELVDDRGLPDALLEEKRAQALCLRALEAMDFEKRAVLVAFDIEGRSAQELSEILGVPLNTAYSRIRLARAEFERHVARLTGGES